MESSRKKVLIDFSKKIGVHFRNLDLLDLALHHRSYSNENAQFEHKNNERLEFLGDSVLALSTADFLYGDMVDSDEGELSRIMSLVVSEKALAPISKDKLGLDRLLVMGHGEEVSGGRNKAAILADAFESVMGAVYLDQGYETARNLILKYIVPVIRMVQDDKVLKNYKTILQEYYQRQCKDCPKYELVRATGPDHEKTFFVRVHLGQVAYGPEAGNTKKNAEQNAARSACIALGLED